MPTPNPTPLERQQMQIARPAGATFWHTVRFELVGALADEVRAATILDIGAGAGLLGDWVLTHRAAVQYRFEETSPLLDEQLTARFGASRRGDRLERIPASTLVAMLDVLEHIDDDAGALRGIVGRMERGAHLVATVPAGRWAFSSWDEQLGHVRRYSKRTLRDLASAAGLTPLRVDYLFPELLPLLPLRKVRPAPRTHADFPQLGPRLTRLGHAVSSATATRCRWWPAGTSVLLFARRDARA